MGREKRKLLIIGRVGREEHSRPIVGLKRKLHSPVPHEIPHEAERRGPLGARLIRPPSRGEERNTSKIYGILKSNIAVKIENPGSKPNQGRH